MARRCETNWINSYLKYTANASPPEIYHKWIAVSLIAGALQRKVGINTAFFNIYPNHYIVLVGPPGVGKSTACGVGTYFLERLNGVNFTAQSATREALIKKLSESFQPFSTKTGDIVVDENGEIELYGQSAVTALVNEFSSLLASDQINMIEFLTDIYDHTGSKWTHSTIGSGERVIYYPCLNLLSCTTQKRLIELIPRSAIEGGFVSRTIFVYSDEPRHEDSHGKPIEPFYVLSSEELQIREDLEHDLTEISELRGDFNLTESAMARYKEWFQEHTKALRSEYAEGFIERKRSHILKLAIILSAAEDSVTIIEKKHIEQAIDMLNEVEPLMVRAFAGAGDNKLASHIARIATQIRSRGEVSVSELLEVNTNNVTLQDFEEIVTVLRQTGKIKERADGRGNRVLSWAGK